MKKKKEINRFQRNPKKTLAATIILLLILGLSLFNFILSTFRGLGNPVLYYPYPLYGYRPFPNQEVTRTYGTVVKINNLSLRADGDWDNNIENKVLFLGDSVTYGGSYIANGKLFSCLAVEEIPGYESGNAGVNGWGIENIHGLIVNYKFLPARLYVTTLIEDDLYRGMVRLTGLPYWSRKPYCALQELLYYFLHKESQTRYVTWQSQANSTDVVRAYEQGVRKLKELDDFFKSNGYQHLIYISPYLEQVLGLQEEDPILLRLFHKYDLHPTYLLDRIKTQNLSPDDIRSLYHDFKHLSKNGHALWGKMMGEDISELIGR